MRFTIVIILAFLIGAAVFAEIGQTERRLLRADPDALTADPDLRRFAVRRGQPLFLVHCAVCHGAAGAGDRIKGVPDLTDGDWLYGGGRVADIERIIEYGIRFRHPKTWSLAVMPAYGQPQPNPADPNIHPLAPGQIDDLIEFLLRQQGREANAAAASRGAALYAGDAGCYDCHALDAKGDAAIGAPNLTDAVSLYGDGSREALFLSIAQGRQGVCPAWIMTLSAAGIRETAFYVYSISHREGFHAD